MTYIKKEFRQILYLADKNFTIPNCFYKYISKKEKSHNLIIKSKGYTTTKVAMESKVSESTINAYINGQKLPSVTSLISMSEFLTFS